jgi:hypothetical protein
MDKKALADLIHEWNDCCNNHAQQGHECELCWRIAGNIMVAQAAELRDAGAERMRPASADEPVLPGCGMRK